MIATVTFLFMLSGLIAALTTLSETSHMAQNSDLLTMKNCPEGKTELYTGAGQTLGGYCIHRYFEFTEAICIDMRRFLHVGSSIFFDWKGEPEAPVAKYG